MRQSQVSHHCCERETLADLMAICVDSENRTKLYKFDFHSCEELYGIIGYLVINLHVAGKIL